MKNLVITTGLILAIVFAGNKLSAQEFTTEKGTAETVKVEHVPGKIEMTEYNGNSVKIQAIGYQKEEVPEKAKGLKQINANGEDNTGIGLEMKKAGGKISFTGVGKISSKTTYKFSIPKGMSVDIDNSQPWPGEDITIDGFSGDLEIKTMNEDITLKNVTGPMTINSMNGDIKTDFTEVNQTAPITITSMNSELDISLPSNTPANINLSSMSGNIYTDFDIDFDQKQKENGLRYIGGGSQLEGKINGGGVMIMLKSMNDNIYLRKK